MPDAAPMIVASGLRKVYGGRGESQIVAVDEVSFTVDAGECLAIVGESGSGKTTIARMLVGLERPTGGTIRVCGRERTDQRPSSRERRRRGREMQIVFQDPYLSLDRLQRTGDAIETSIAIQFDLRPAERRRRMLSLLEQVGLHERHAAMFPRQLSGGQRQRVAIARALAAEPSIVILDEAVAALDVSIQAQILNLLNEIRRNRTISYVFISHDLAVVNQVSDRSIVMSKGKVVENGTTSAILASPQHPYTRRLLSAVPRPGWRPQRLVAVCEPG